LRAAEPMPDERGLVQADNGGLDSVAPDHHLHCVSKCFAISTRVSHAIVLPIQRSIGFAVFRSSISPVLGHFISLQLIGCINSPATPVSPQTSRWYRKGYLDFEQIVHPIHSSQYSNNTIADLPKKSRCQNSIHERGKYHFRTNNITGSET
jgi:hypothetical protein